MTCQGAIVVPTYEFNELHNGIEIYFESKPSADVLCRLKSNGWRWNGAQKCWYTKKSESSIAFAESLCGNPPSTPVQNIQTSYPKKVSFDQFQGGKVVSNVSIEVNASGQYQLSSTSNLIICADCKRFFSIHASQCPFCGCPLSHTVNTYIKNFSANAVEQERKRIEEESRRKEAERKKAVKELKEKLPSWMWKHEYNQYTEAQCESLWKRKKKEIEEQERRDREYEEEKKRERAQRYEEVRIAAVADLKERLTTQYGKDWDPAYEKYSLSECHTLLERLKKEKERNVPQRKQPPTLAEQIKNKTGPSVTFGKELRGCSGNCSTCERTDCVKYMSNEK